MLRWLMAIGTFLTTGSETGSSTNNPEAARWSVAVKAHSQFDIWT